MSAVAPVAAAATAALSVINPIEAFFNFLNTNPYFIGIMMLVLNLGGRFITLEITKQQELFLQHPWVRRFLIFIVLFVATRNIYVAFWATVCVVLFLGYLFNENSALCIFGKHGTNGSKCSESQPQQNEMTPEEKEILQRLHAKSTRVIPIKEEITDTTTHMDIYAANLALLRK